MSAKENPIDQPRKDDEVNDQSEEEPQVFAVNEDINDKVKFSRRTFLELAAASAAALAGAGIGKATSGLAKGEEGIGRVMSLTDVNLYAGPADHLSTLESFSDGDIVELLGRNSDQSWMQVKTEADNIGWVRAEFLDFNKIRYEEKKDSLFSGSQTEVYLPIVFNSGSTGPPPTPCSCDEVCTCDTVCSCDGFCSCDTVCSCDGDCSCDNFCTCDQVCTCDTIHYWYPN